MDKIRRAKTLMGIVNIKFGFDLCGGRRYYINLVKCTKADHMLSKVKI